MQPGTYNGTVERLDITEAESGAIMVYLDLVLETGERTTASMCLVQISGAISSITMDTLKAVFGWDGSDPLQLMEPEMHAGKPCSVKADWDKWTDKKTGMEKSEVRVKYVNPVGGGIGRGKPIDKDVFRQKFGSKFRAMSVGKSLPPPKRTPLPPPKSSATPAPVSTLEECWGLLLKVMAGQDPAFITEEWAKVLAKVAPGKGDDLTPQEWGKVKAELAEMDNIPY